MADHPYHALWNGTRQWDAQPEDDPGHVDSLSSHILTSAFKDAGNPGWPQPWDHLYGQSSHTEPSHFNPSMTRDPYAEALGAGLLSAESHSTNEPNLDDSPKNDGSNILADDIACVELSADDLALRGHFRILVVLKAIVRGTGHHWQVHPKVRELWIRMIEGNDLTDDVWLWMDGDEEWLRGHLGPDIPNHWFRYRNIEVDRVDGQSALRRRINQSRHLRNNAGNLRRERIRNATREQRLAAIYWLTFDSNHVKDLSIELGRTPRGMFKLSDMVLDIHIHSSWDAAFPRDSAAWEVAVTKLKEDGCTCLERKEEYLERTEEYLRSWFNMLSWLDGKPPKMEVIGSYWACAHCESWAKSRYDRYRLDFQGTLPRVPLWDALCFGAIEESGSTSLALAKAAFLSRLVSPGARQRVQLQLRSRLVISHRQDVTYMPYINDHYPRQLRPCAAWLSCTAGLPPCTEHLTSIDIRDGLLDDAPLVVILGVIAWVAACLESPPVRNGNDEHDEEWHNTFRSTLLETFTECPLPKLSLKGVAFCAELCFDGGPRLFSDDGDSELDPRTLKTFVAVAIFLRNKNVLLHCCRRCQVLFARFFSDTVLSASLDIEDPVTEDNDEELDVPDGVPDLAVDHAVTGKGNSLISEDLVGMEAFTVALINKNLPKEQLQSQLATKFNLLTRYADSIGLNVSVGLLPSGSSDGSSISGPTDGNSRKCPIQRSSTQFTGLAKADKIEQIKERLLEMLSKS
ncbi:hypothetical protein SCLCIDRAFT_1207123 [Scleroderma citrinum Foug A]|uniref:Uncharacterized protein n=1 Tax=Scleroderma citrinum Foug A TaxID=1036808 RepID=A0A0C3ES26_9AGAM|nr:hypothetical protein SCLCIDRAFT_1207123 [Scleroderma citrinum Foug A]